VSVIDPGFSSGKLINYLMLVLQNYSKISTTKSREMQIIKDEDFGPYIQPDLADFISLSLLISRLPPDKIPRHMVGRILLEASKCEELLDAFGAPKNEYWAPVRMASAVAKAFSRVIYNMFHIYHSIRGYNLLKVEDDFISATRESLFALLGIFSDASGNFVETARRMKLNEMLVPEEEYRFRNTPVDRKLASNLGRKTAGNSRDTAVNLATRFLNLAEKCDWLDVHERLKPEQYHGCIPDTISEVKLRHVANDFHNLQSMYDTYLSASDLAESDGNLPVLRGQISVVFHLLDTVVTLVHFYERHALSNWNTNLKSSIANKRLLTIIIEYFIAFADKYIKITQELCKNILQSYAVQGEIEVPIPNYRGFHVRPSTLIAKIIMHYGSEVKMKFDETVYDASFPLELFRANEKLNQYKRDAVTKYSLAHRLVKNDAGASYEATLMRKILRAVFLDLLEKQKIMIYDNNFSFDDIEPHASETLGEFIKRAIVVYLATGKIDIISGDTVRFQGDIRVLEDIKALADSGYGEDKFGNNVVLPNNLSYLKR